MKELYGKYRLKKKRLKTVIEELKQRMQVKIAKVKRNEQRIEQFRQNKIFDLKNFYQTKIYAELNKNGIRSNDVPNTEECIKFWSNIQGVRKEHKQRGPMIEMSEERKSKRRVSSRKSERKC